MSKLNDDSVNCNGRISGGCGNQRYYLL